MPPAIVTVRVKRPTGRRLSSVVPSSLSFRRLVLMARGDAGAAAMGGVIQVMSASFVEKIDKRVV